MQPNCYFNVINNKQSATNVCELINLYVNACHFHLTNNGNVNADSELESDLTSVELRLGLTGLDTSPTDTLYAIKCLASLMMSLTFTVVGFRLNHTLRLRHQPEQLVAAWRRRGERLTRPRSA